MRILIVEDEARLAAGLAEHLKAAGFLISVVGDGMAALESLTHDPEAVSALVLDLGLPGFDGVAVLQELRRRGHGLPVLVLTARSRWADKLAAFNAGADDYVTKPFEAEEVVVRLRALLRRSAGQATPELRYGPVSLDPEAGRVLVRDRPIALTAQEFRILSYFLHNPGTVISRDRLIAQAWDADPGSNVVEVLIGRLRRKLGVALIETVRGEGYRLAAPAAPAPP